MGITRASFSMRRLSVAVVLLAVVVQLVPYGRRHTNPPVIAEPAWNSPRTRATFFRVCSDCHSDETVWPWYSHVAPASWLVQWDVDRGRAQLNVSRWGTGENEGDEAARMVRSGRMPPRQYLWAHADARLSATERRLFESGLAATFGADGGENDEDELGEKAGYLD